MLHKKISVSSQVNRLSLPTRLLFTWMIAHADDEGRLKGDPEYIKATVVPMTNWSFKRIKGYLEEIANAKLIHYWQRNNEWFVEFAKWDEHQTIRNDRRVPSNLPSFTGNNDSQLTATSQPDDNQETPQFNISELNKIEVNKSEYQDNPVQPIADKNSFKKVGEVIDLNTYKPNSEVESAAYEAWKKLELGNPAAYRTTYLAVAKKGLPPDLFYQFTSEIKQDPSIKNPGAVFNKKVNDYLKSKK